MLLSLQQVTAQSLAINTDGSTADASALLDVKSTAKGMLIPRMRSVERTAIGAPAGGLLVYDVDSLAFSYYNGTVWTFLKADADTSKGWSVNGNTVTNSNFIGTNNNRALRFKTFSQNAGFLDSTSQGTALGFRSLINNTGLRNTAFGFNSLSSLITANSESNTAIGNAALASATNSQRNTAVGDSALALNISAFANTAVGAFAAKKTTSAANAAFGRSALENNTTGQANTALGYYPLYNNISGYGNVAIGERPGYNNETGNFNIAIGSQASYWDTSGYSNIAIGPKALFFSRNKNNLIAIGDSALYSNGFGGIGTEGSRNTAVGSKALYANTVGTGNTALGFNALNFPTTGTNNTAIGTYSNIQFEGLTNATAIGAVAIVAASNSMVLGSINGVGGANADTKVGIGVTDPTDKLEIGRGRLRFRGNIFGGNAHGITWTNNAGTVDRAFIGMETDDLLGIFGLNFSTWNIRVHNTTGEMGIFKQPSTATDQSRLQVKQSNTGATRGIGIETAINTNRWDMWVDNNAAPDYNFNYNGTLRGYIQNATGNYIVVSDRRFKKDVTDFSGSLANLNQLKTYQYHYLDNIPTDPLSIGFMAQDVQKIFPGAVSEKTMDDGQKRLGINYQYFTVLAIKGIQEQQLIIENQNKKIENLQAQIDEIKKLIKKD